MDINPGPLLRLRRMKGMATGFRTAVCSVFQVVPWVVPMVGV